LVRRESPCELLWRPEALDCRVRIPPEASNGLTPKPPSLGLKPRNLLHPSQPITNRATGAASASLLLPYGPPRRENPRLPWSPMAFLGLLKSCISPPSAVFLYFVVFSVPCRLGGASIARVLLIGQFSYRPVPFRLSDTFRPHARPIPPTSPVPSGAASPPPPQPPGRAGLGRLED